MPQQIAFLFPRVRSEINRKVNTERLEVVGFYPDIGLVLSAECLQVAALCLGGFCRFMS